MHMECNTWSHDATMSIAIHHGSDNECYSSIINIIDLLISFKYVASYSEGYNIIIL